MEEKEAGIHEPKSMPGSQWQLPGMGASLQVLTVLNDQRNLICDLLFVDGCLCAQHVPHTYW